MLENLFFDDTMSPNITIFGIGMGSNLVRDTLGIDAAVEYGLWPKKLKSG